ncbi:hypothetical protein [Kitasatospora aureofaciens]|uniref:hypothetical protein n=1 Tax=Kitasatospora aureofaciens TaxID=1894 RepID=UPI001C47693B|nr:hypothetical protein [Kitasatospora aureofaciens]MBV6699321.1 hypothetical protein [Kitasatospora aureofaciens]
MAPNLQTDDTVVQKVLATLESHMDAMTRAATQVENVNGEVQQHFKAACSTQYQQKIEDWQHRYQQLKNAYQTFHSSFGAGHHQVNNAHDQALDVGAGWGGASADIYNGLNP